MRAAIPGASCVAIFHFVVTWLFSGTRQHQPQDSENLPQKISRGPCSVCWGEGYLWSVGFWNAAMLEIKHECYAVWQADGSDKDRLKAGIRHNQGHRQGHCLLTCEGLLKKGGVNFPLTRRQNKVKPFSPTPTSLIHLSELNSAK